MIYVTGTLKQPAEHRTGTLGQAVLICLIDAGGGLPFELRLHVGDDAADHKRAEAEAEALKVGAPLEVQAKALRHRTDHGAECFVLQDVGRVTFNGRVWS